MTHVQGQPGPIDQYNDDGDDDGNEDDKVDDADDDDRDSLIAGAFGADR